MKEKMEQLLRWRLEDISDDVYFLVAGYDAKWRMKHVSLSLDDKRKAIANDKQRIQDRYDEFNSALEIFEEAEMISKEEAKMWRDTGKQMRREGKQAVRYFYEGKDWYKEYLEDSNILRHR